MFILTPIAINSSLTFKQAQVCSPTMILTSLTVFQDSPSLSSSCSLKVFKRYREGEGIETPFYYPRVWGISLTIDTMLKILIVGM